MENIKILVEKIFNETNEFCSEGYKYFNIQTEESKDILLVDIENILLELEELKKLLN